MTKNEDVSWIPKPVGCSLKRFTTDELVAELKGRHELCPVVDEMTREPVCLFVTTLESLVTELCKRDGVKHYTAGEGDIVDVRITYPYGGTGNEETNGPCKILVVRE